MRDVPLALSGPLTIALIVVLGIFIYPRLLRRPLGRVAVAVATLALAALFMAFEAANESSSSTAMALAGLLSLAPAVAGIVVARLQGSSPP